MSTKEVKRFNKWVSNAEGTVTLIVICGLVLAFAFCFAMVNSPSAMDRLTGVLLVGLIAIVGYRWAEARKVIKHYHVTYNLPEQYETTLNFDDLLSLTWKILRYYNKGEVTSFGMSVRELTEEEKQQLEEED